MLDKLFLGGMDLLALVLPISIAAANIVFFPLAAFWLFGARWTWPRWGPVWGRPETFFLLYLGVSLASAFFGIDRAHSLKEIKNKDFYILIAIVIVALVRSREQNVRMWKIFMAAGLFTAVWGMIQCGVGVNVAEKTDPNFLHLPAALAHWPRPLLNLLALVNGRVEGTRGHPLAYAECLLFNWAFAMAFLVACRGRQVVKWIVYSVLIGGGLLVSQSRGPWIAAAVVALLAILQSASSRRWFILGIGLFFLAVFAAIPSLRGRALSIMDRKHNSNKERVHMWRAGWQMWKSHPVLGIGPGNVKGISVAYQTADEKIWGPWGHLHSTYMNCLVERGLLGLAAFLLFLGSLGGEIWEGMRKPSNDPWRKVLYKGTLLGMIGFLIGGFTETAYNTAVVMMTFYFVVGLALAMARHEKSATVS